MRQHQLLQDNNCPPSITIIYTGIRMPLTQYELALEYIKIGISIFPCKMDKTPLTKTGFKDATTDPKQVKKWFYDHEDRMIGAPNDQFTVLDDDAYKYCPVSQLLTKQTREALVVAGVDSPVKVRTINGGEHIYFKKDESLTRRLKFLPNIDLLANHGYSILPDEKNYVLGNPEPWKLFDNLPTLDTIKLDTIVEQFSEFTSTCKVLNDVHQGKRKLVGFEKGSSKKSTAPKEEKKSLRYDLTDDGVKFNQKSTEETYLRGDYDGEVLDPSISLLNENGKIRIERTQISDSGFLLKLFHNQEIQKKLGKFLGLDVPTVGETNVQHSIFKGHVDEKPSMGVRWNSEKTHIIIRDFSNFYCDKKNNLDFNLTRLYATLKMGSLMDRPNNMEHNILFLSLLDEAGLLDIDKVSYFDDISGLTGVTKIVATRIADLVSYRLLFKSFDGFVCLTRAFGSMFCGVSPSSINNAKEKLYREQYIVSGGHIPTNGESLFYSTQAIVLRDNMSDEPEYHDFLDPEIVSTAAKKYREFGEKVDKYQKEQWKEKNLKKTKASVGDIVNKDEKLDEKLNETIKSERTPLLELNAKTQIENGLDLKDNLNERIVATNALSVVQILKKRREDRKKLDANVDANVDATTRYNLKETIDANVDANVDTTLKKPRLYQILTKVNIDAIRENLKDPIERVNRSNVKKHDGRCHTRDRPLNTLEGEYG